MYAASAEFLGTFLLIAVISFIGNPYAIGAALTVGILLVGNISGGHFNPAVSLVMAWRKALPRQRLVGYVLAQLLGAALGAWLAHAMFELPILQWSAKVRTGPAQWLAEAVATGGLLLVILRAPVGKTPALVACYIGAAYWFTASTSFANPAAVFGRMMSDSFAGIAPQDAPGFVLAQLAGALGGVFLHKLLGDSKAIP